MINGLLGGDKRSEKMCSEFGICPFFCLQTWRTMLVYETALLWFSIAEHFPTSASPHTKSAGLELSHTKFHKEYSRVATKYKKTQVGS